MTAISASIFRAYDIRGIVNETLTAEGVFAIGRVLGSLALEKGEKTLVVGRDGRLSGPALFAALTQGILAAGCDVIDIGEVSTPLLYYCTFVMDTRSGVMLTGSHNPANYNGLKIVINAETLAEDAISNIYQRVIADDYASGTGKLRSINIDEQYMAKICSDVVLKRKLKIVVDCGNGIAGKMAPDLYRRMGCEVVELFCDVDGHFPNHHPDPSQAENLQDLILKVKATQADIGLAFDGDGDRIGVVTSAGEIIWPDRLLMLYAKSILKTQPNAKIIYDVKCSMHLDALIREFGGEPIMWKTGHSLIKRKLIETQAAIAGEMSGHVFIKDRWYGFDDAIYAGARLLEILALTADDSAALFSSIPNSVNTPELKIYVTDEDKFLIMDQLLAKADFANAEINTIDGLRVNFSEGWGLIRSSNTTPCLVLRFEATTQAAMKEIQHLFRELILSVQPNLALSF